MNPQTFAHFLQVVAFMAATVIFWRSEPIINLMEPGCRVMVRLAFWLLAVGSAALIVGITQGYEPTLPVVLSLCGTALLLINERRIKGLLRLHTPITKERRVAP